MRIFKKKESPFASSEKILAKHGFTGEYISVLRTDISNAVKYKDINNGKCRLCNALIICGHLSESTEVFSQIDIAKLDSLIAPTLLHNVVFSLFIAGKLNEADELYRNYNKIILSEHTDSMRRTLAIHEHINGRYENSVTVYAKLSGSKCRFIDICFIMSLLALDMFERAQELLPSLDKYEGLYELGEIASGLKNTVNDGLSGII